MPRIIYRYHSVTHQTLTDTSHIHRSHAFVSRFIIIYRADSIRMTHAHDAEAMDGGVQIARSGLAISTSTVR